MKIELPTNLIEFILSGILIEVLLINIIPIDFEIGSSFFSGLVLISGAYLSGLALNAIATFYVNKTFEKRIKRETIMKQLFILNPVKNEIKEKFDLPPYQFKTKYKNSALC
jgi:hypothetical protein